jgi:hypothetical protein
LVRAGYLTARSTIVPGKLHLLPTHEGAKYVRRYALDTFFGAVQWQPR